MVDRCSRREAADLWSNVTSFCVPHGLYKVFNCPFFIIYLFLVYLFCLAFSLLLLHSNYLLNYSVVTYVVALYCLCPAAFTTNQNLVALAVKVLSIKIHCRCSTSVLRQRQSKLFATYAGDLLKFKSFHLPACYLPIHPLCDCICVYCNTPSPVLSPLSCTTIMRNIYLVMSAPFLHERTHAQPRSLVCLSANLSGCAIVCAFHSSSPPPPPGQQQREHPTTTTITPQGFPPQISPSFSRTSPVSPPAAPTSTLPPTPTPSPLLLPSLPTTL